MSYLERLYKHIRHGVLSVGALLFFVYAVAMHLIELPFVILGFTPPALFDVYFDVKRKFWL